MIISSNLGTKSLKVRAPLQRQIAKLASGLLCSWSLLRNNNTAKNLQMFSSSYGSRQRCHLWCHNIRFDVFRNFFDVWYLRYEFGVENNFHIV